MTAQDDEVKKLVAIATDFGLATELRSKAIEQLGKIVTHDALLAVLDLVANEKLIKKERELALKQAGAIIKSGY